MTTSSAVLEAEHVTRRFGDTVALDDVSLRRAARRDRRAAGSQRCRQDDAAQPGDRAAAAGLGRQAAAATALPVLLGWGVLFAALAVWAYRRDEGRRFR